VAGRSDWVVIGGKVLDISSFYSRHPGGRDILIKYSGKDATELFKGKPHSMQAEKLLDDYTIGYLRDETVESDGRLEVPVGKYRVFVVLDEEAPTIDTEVLWKPINSAVFKMQQECFDPTFLKLMASAAGRVPGEMPAFMEHLTVERNLTYSFPIFTPQFASQIIAELEHYLKYSTKNPNGLQLKEFGFENFVRSLLSEHLLHLIRLLFPKHSTVAKFGDVYTKVVKYSQGHEEDWPMHEDASDITINICLGAEFVGTDLILMGTADEGDDQVIQYRHRPGRLIMHEGANRHGVSWLKSGTRYSLITLLTQPM